MYNQKEAKLLFHDFNKTNWKKKKSQHDSRLLNFPYKSILIDSTFYFKETVYA